MVSGLACFATIQSAAAKRINCDDSTLCGDKKGFLEKLTDIVTDNINGVDPSYHFSNGEQIACAGHICAFLQKTSNGASGQEVRDGIVKLRNHGCKACGSYPFIDNDVGKGELTVNYVTNDCGQGVCNGALNPKRQGLGNLSRHVI
ncbi:killer toxin Kp4/SMK [Fusarium solani]|uniref:Killer toxin Kp4/SMK n=1 Tax=Fusarium solani TaxID=169388 RepID=A0A9P9H0S9_FUSSL|nr:killer toxin Kp4/SMK [Fusarium solani]KAH7248255.1 killer toxin Kp4/SMK [Fusarium solani]